MKKEEDNRGAAQSDEVKMQEKIARPRRSRQEWPNPVEGGRVLTCSQHLQHGRMAIQRCERLMHWRYTHDTGVENDHILSCVTAASVATTVTT